MRCKLGFRAKNHHGFFFPFFLFFFFFNCNSTAAPPTWSSALCPAAFYMCFPWEAAGKTLLPPARHQFWACPRELVNCTPVGGLGGEQAWGPCQGEKAPPPLHWNSLPFLICALGKSNTGHITRMSLCQTYILQKPWLPSISLSPKDPCSNPGTTLTSCVTLNKPLNLSKLPFPHLWWG